MAGYDVRGLARTRQQKSIFGCLVTDEPWIEWEADGWMNQTDGDGDGSWRGRESM